MYSIKYNMAPKKLLIVQADTRNFNALTYIGLSKQINETVASNSLGAYDYKYINLL